VSGTAAASRTPAGPLRPLLRPLRPGDARTEAELREHYEIEKALAARLRAAAREARLTLYRELYDELFRRVPHHPMLTRGTERQALSLQRQQGFLARFLFPGAVYLEIGPGDCAHALGVARVAAKVYAVDVSSEIMQRTDLPQNFELRLSDGSSIPVPAGTIELAFSNQLMEHLHPEDAREQLRNIHASLAPGGRYACITPNRLYGPRDVSEHFDEIATGFHLHEYTASELAGLFRQIGFKEVTCYVGARGAYLPFPTAILGLVERLLEAMPYRLRKRLADNPPMRAFLGVRITGRKDPRPAAPSSRA
jgi:SAM-dependent methyltransferase